MDKKQRIKELLEKHNLVLFPYEVFLRCCARIEDAHGTILWSSKPFCFGVYDNPWESLRDSVLEYLEKYNIENIGKE